MTRTEPLYARGYADQDLRNSLSWTEYNNSNSLIDTQAVTKPQIPQVPGTRMDTVIYTVGHGLIFQYCILQQYELESKHRWPIDYHVVSSVCPSFEDVPMVEFT